MISLLLLIIAVPLFMVSCGRPSGPNAQGRPGTAGATSGQETGGDLDMDRKWTLEVEAPPVSTGESQDSLISAGGRGTEAVLGPGRMVTTGPGGACSLRLPDGTEMKMGPDSALKTMISGFILRRGSTWVRVEKRADGRFTVETPSAILGVMGTEFSVRVGEAGETEARLFSGRLKIGNESGEIVLEPGEGCRVEKGGPPRMTAGDSEGSGQVQGKGARGANVGGEGGKATDGPGADEVWVDE